MSVLHSKQARTAALSIQFFFFFSPLTSTNPASDVLFVCNVLYCTLCVCCVCAMCAGESIDALFVTCARSILGKVETGVIDAATVVPTDVLNPGLADNKPKLPREKCWC